MLWTKGFLSNPRIQSTEITEFGQCRNKSERRLDQVVTNVFQKTFFFDSFQCEKHDFELYHGPLKNLLVILLFKGGKEGLVGAIFKRLENVVIVVQLGWVTLYFCVGEHEGVERVEEDASFAYLSEQERNKGHIHTQSSRKHGQPH